MKDTMTFNQLKKCLKESNSEYTPYYNMLSVDTWEDLYDMLGKAFKKWPELKERKVMVSNKNALIEYPFGMQFVIGPNKPKMYLVSAENFRDRLVSKEFDRVPLDEDNEDVITIPKNLGEFGRQFNKEQEDFINWANKQFNGNVYDSLVSDRLQEVDGTRLDVDDWQTYKFSEQTAIDEENFLRSLLETIDGEFGPNEQVPVSKMVEFIKKEGRKIAETAFEEFEPSDDFLVYRGRWRF